MRVLSVIHGSMFGGPHNRNLRVAPLLAQRGIQTTVLLPDEPGNAAQRLRDGGVECVTMPLHRLRATLKPASHVELVLSFWREVSAIRALIRDRSIDVVQINGLVNPHAAFAAARERRAVVWQILDTYSPMLLRRAAMQLVTRMAGSLMCTGRSVAAAHPGALQFGPRLVTFFPPVDPVVFHPAAEVRLAVRRELGFADNDFVVGTVGNVNTQKGHIAFVAAAARLKRLVPAARFVILGATYAHFQDYTDRLKHDAQQAGLIIGRDLIMRDPGTRVPELEQAFDLFWMTSRPNSEGIPTTVEEALTLGIPVVAFNVGSVAEAVDDGVSGSIVPCEDIDALVRATRALIDDRKALERIACDARRTALQRFSHVACAETHVAAYKIAYQELTIASRK